MSQLTQQKGSRPQAPSEAANTAVKISGSLDMEDSSGWACHGPQLPSPAGKARCSPFSSSARDCGGSLLYLSVVTMFVTLSLFSGLRKLLEGPPTYVTEFP